MKSNNIDRKERMSLFTSREATTKDKIFMGVLFGLLFLSIAVYKVTSSETVPLLLLALLVAILAADCLLQLRLPQYKRVARRYMIIGMICLIVCFVVLFLAVKPYLF